MVGSSLEPAGHIASIAVEEGPLDVRPPKGVTFVQDSAVE